jgi:DNA (cytosine-5)-methyltransferase 1
MKALSLFANVGIGECYLEENGIEVVVANEFLEDRAEFYRKLYPNTNMICGDITNPDVYNSVKEAAEGIDLIIATPPCQGMSIAHAKRATKDDSRNSLIMKVVDFINDLNPKYVLVENVSGMAKTFINHNGEPVLITKYIENNIPEHYTIKYKVLNASDYGTPQNRKRLITLFTREERWVHPDPLPSKITVRQAIGHLPSLESGEESDIPWHSGCNHNDNHIKWMQHTPTGESAFDNDVYFPSVKCEQLPGTEKKKSFNFNVEFNGPSEKKIKEGKPILSRCVYFPDKDEFRRQIAGFKSTYRRMNWDEPAPTVTMTNGSVNSQNNVHPGNKLPSGLYSDARVLSVREILILCGLPADWLDDHQEEKESFIRKVLGECFPPKFSLAIIKNIGK